MAGDEFRGKERKKRDERQTERSRTQKLPTFGKENKWKCVSRYNEIKTLGTTNRRRLKRNVILLLNFAALFNVLTSPSLLESGWMCCERSREPGKRRHLKIPSWRFFTVWKRLLRICLSQRKGKVYSRLSFSAGVRCSPRFQTLEFSKEVQLQEMMLVIPILLQFCRLKILEMKIRQWFLEERDDVHFLWYHECRRNSSFFSWKSREDEFSTYFHSSLLLQQTTVWFWNQLKVDPWSLHSSLYFFFHFHPLFSCFTIFPHISFLLHVSFSQPESFSFITHEDANTHRKTGVHIS